MGKRIQSIQTQLRDEELDLGLKLDTLTGEICIKGDHTILLLTNIFTQLKAKTTNGATLTDFELLSSVSLNNSGAAKNRYSGVKLNSVTPFYGTLHD